MCTFVLPVLQCVGVFRKMKTSGLCSQWLTLRGLLSVFPHIFVQGSCFLICIPPPRPPPPPPPPPPPSCHTPCFTPSLTHHFVTHHLSHTQLCHTPSLSHCHHLSHTIFHTPHTTHHLSHTTLSHTILSHTIFHIPSLTPPLCHTPSFTHHLSHTTLSPTIFHTPLRHPPLFHTPLCHTQSFTHNFVTHHLSHTIFVTNHLSLFVTPCLLPTIFHTQLCHTPSSIFHTSAAALCVAGVALDDIHLAHLGTLGRAWARLGAGDAAQLGDICPGFAGQAWHLVTSTFVLRGSGRRGHLQHWAGSGCALGRAWAHLGTLGRR